MTGHRTIVLTPAKTAALLGALAAIVAVTAVATAWLPGSGGSYGEAKAQAAEEEHPQRACGEGDKRNSGAEHGREQARVLSLSKSAVALAEIETVVVGKGDLSVGADAPAEVQLNPERVAHVASLVAGQIGKINASLGDQIEAGQRLAVIRSVAFGEARARLPRAQAAYEVAKSSFERQQLLRAEGIASERALLEAKARLHEAKALRAAARAGLSVFGAGAGGGAEFSLLSPLDGTVIQRHASFGESIGPDDTLFVVADLSRVWVVGRLYEQQVAAARVGAATAVRTHAYPGRVWTGKLSYVASTLDETTRTLEVRLDLDNPDGVLKPGLFARITLAASTKKDVLEVPLAAIQTQKGESFVFISRGAGRFERREVTLGLRGPIAAEVLTGLAEGDEVVTKGSFILASELAKEGFEGGDAH